MTLTGTFFILNPPQKNEAPKKVVQLTVEQWENQKL